MTRKIDHLGVIRVLDRTTDRGDAAISYEDVRKPSGRSSSNPVADPARRPRGYLPSS
jgi:hypothetical protein